MQFPYLTPIIIGMIIEFVVTPQTLVRLHTFGKFVVSVYSYHWAFVRAFEKYTMLRCTPLWCFHHRGNAEYLWGLGRFMT